MRWTVDTPEDLAFVRRIYEHFGHDRFSWRGSPGAVSGVAGDQPRRATEGNLRRMGCN